MLELNPYMNGNCIKINHDKRCHAILMSSVTLCIAILAMVFMIYLLMNMHHKRYEIKIIQHNIEDGAENYNITNNLWLYNNSDIIMLQEAFTSEGIDTSHIIASLLNMNYVSFINSSLAVISRFNISIINTSLRSATVKIDTISGGPIVYVIVLHFDDWFYQPFQAAYLPYDRDGVYQPNTTDSSELIKYALNARGEDVLDVIKSIKNIKSIDNNANIIIGGDFNEPSYLDWTKKNKDFGFCPVEVNFPSTYILENIGLIDCYRYINPDEVMNQGLTWPDRVINYSFRSDRIDMTFVNDKLKSGIINVRTLDNTKSDHKALLTQIIFTN